MPPAIFILDLISVDLSWLLAITFAVFSPCPVGVYTQLQIMAFWDSITMQKFCRSLVQPYSCGQWLYLDLHTEQLPLSDQDHKIILTIFISVSLLNCCLVWKGNVFWGRMNTFRHMHWKWRTPAAEEPLWLPLSFREKLMWALSQHPMRVLPSAWDTAASWAAQPQPPVPYLKWGQSLLLDLKSKTKPKCLPTALSSVLIGRAWFQQKCTREAIGNHITLLCTLYAKSSCNCTLGAYGTL